MAKSVVAFGELLWDMLPNGRVLGGAPANFIFRINSFGDRGSLISRLGDDDLGDEALALVRDLELSTEHIQRDDLFPTGTVDVVLDRDGNADYTINRDVAYDHIELASEMIDLVREADCICFGTLIQRYGIAKNTLRELLKEAPNVDRFLDVNLRKDCYSQQSVEESLEMATILKINDEELFAVKSLIGLNSDTLKDLAQELIEQYQLKVALVTLGEKGAFVLDASGQYFYDAGYQVKLIDTVGAGDACSAGFIHYYLNGKSLQESLCFGNATGAMVATTEGATQSISKSEILSFIEESCERLSL